MSIGYDDNFIDGSWGDFTDEERALYRKGHRKCTLGCLKFFP